MSSAASPNLGGSCLAGLAAFVAGSLAVAFVVAGHGMVGLLFGLAALAAGRGAGGFLQAAPAEPTPLPPPFRTSASVGPTPAQRQADVERHLAQREAALAARRPPPPPQKRTDPDAPKVTWTHPDLWAGDVSKADLDPDEEVRTTLLASQAPGGGPGPAVSTGSLRSRPSAASGTLNSWQQAELSARDWMRRNGYSDARVTAGGADGGIDVTSGRAIAQVKHQLKPVGAAKIRELKGTAASATHKGRSVLFFATYGYSPQAIAAGADLGVQLYQFDGNTWRRAA